MEHEFQVGDKVRHKFLPYETEITRISGDQLWGYWRTKYTDRKIEQFVRKVNAVLIQSAMMPYDPTQQGEDDDSI